MKRMIKSSCRFLVVLTIIAVGVLGSTNPAKASSATMTYIRFNRYGTNIYATYCVSADSYGVNWGQELPSYWHRDSFYGGLNGCTTKLFWANVAGNEKLYYNLVAFPTTFPQDYARHSYVLYIYPSGPNNLSC